MTVDELRAILVDITGRPALRHLPPESPLFRDGAGLDSVTGVALLAAVYERYGVDVAVEDLSLESLASLSELARFVSSHLGTPGAHLGSAATRTLHVVDASTGGGGILSDIAALSREVRAAVGEAGGHVLAESRAVFPNGAVTLLLVLAESHLSLHTWPEERLMALDLFSCGAIDGRAILARLTRTLDLTEVRHREVER